MVMKLLGKVSQYKALHTLVQPRSFTQKNCTTFDSL